MRHADAELARQELVEEKQLAPPEARPPREHVRAPLLVVHRAQRQDAGLNPFRQRDVLDARIDRREAGVERQASAASDGASRVADPGSNGCTRPSSSSAIVSAKSPAAEYDSSTSHSGNPVSSSVQACIKRVGMCRLSRRPVRKKSAQAASAGGRVAQIRDQRRHLRIGGGRPIDLVVQVCETPHGDPFGLQSRRPSSPVARLTSFAALGLALVFRAPRMGIHAALAQKAGEGRGVAMGHEDTLPASRQRCPRARPNRHGRTTRSHGRRHGAAARRGSASTPMRTPTNDRQSGASRYCRGPTAAPQSALRRMIFRAPRPSPVASPPCERLRRDTPRPHRSRRHGRTPGDR